MSTYQPFDEKVLLLQIAAGDEQAFRRLFDMYHDKVYSFAYAHTHSDILADEITQEVFIKIWTAGPKLKEIESLNAWLKVVTRNQTYSQFRKLKTERAIITAITNNQPPAQNATEQKLDAKELNQKLHKALIQLSDQQQTIFRMSREENMSYAAIGTVLGISAFTVNYHLKAIVRHLRNALNDEMELLFIIIVSSIF